MKRLIWNPVAGGSFPTGTEEFLRKKLPNTEICRTGTAGDGEKLAAECSEGELYILGGDGTLREALQGARTSGSSLCLLPAGSGNDFARTLYQALPSGERTWRALLNRNSVWTSRKIDCAEADGQYFLNIASVGFDAEVVQNAEKFKKLPGLRRFSYILSLFYTILFFSGVDLTVKANGRLLQGTALLTAVANGQYYGGGIRIAPEAVVDDGKLEIYFIPKISRLRFLSLLPTLLKGTHTKTRYVTHFPAEEIEIRGKDLLLNLDGDLFRTDRVHIQILPGSVTMQVPAETQFNQERTID